ncbi:MAG: hypothetical protein NXY57DRAFT_969688 [Lentinula lateritia]|nr:MAG: hypothetical protein NXY57DRAFT_969688 [Lentinula lateritia]
MAAAATARSRRGSSPEETSGSPRRPVVEIRREKNKGKGKSKAQPVDEDPDDDDEEDERTPCERCRNKKIPCQMQAGKRSSIICKPCHDAKVKCSYSGRPSIVKREGGANPTGERRNGVIGSIGLHNKWAIRLPVGQYRRRSKSDFEVFEGLLTAAVPDPGSTFSAVCETQKGLNVLNLPRDRPV